MARGHQQSISHCHPLSGALNEHVLHMPQCACCRGYYGRLTAQQIAQNSIPLWSGCLKRTLYHTNVLQSIHASG